MERIEIIISEPWNFESIDGLNLIKGTIMHKEENCILVKSDYILASHNISNQIIKINPRHNTTDYKGQYNNISVNIGLFKYDESEISKASNDENFVFAFIGSIRKEYFQCEKQR